MAVQGWEWSSSGEGEWRGIGKGLQRRSTSALGRGEGEGQGERQGEGQGDGEGERQGEGQVEGQVEGQGEGVLSVHGNIDGAVTGLGVVAWTAIRVRVGQRLSQELQLGLGVR